ncbi:hypothetical protein GPA10_10960 [Streptomyces sp. p1417]|uniref:DNA-directed RNA polymerase specialized sigma subunit, sigma24 family n=1 Tax=Streptomyces typhae TaxID=2681492 RepID=A0A6L6WUQ6_9ACTN|nr:hypothetical protein [Streptomyces typhae]MVO85259.1 hypothetical protein [Streptomyces typhae]
MPTSPRRTSGPVERVSLGQAETALVDQYTGLVRLAYLILPVTLSRHRRVLLAHALVQRALPGMWRFTRRDTAARVPAQRGGDGSPGSGWLLLRVLRAALAHERRPRGWPKRLPPPRALRVMLPVVWGLRLFPRAGGVDEVALGQACGQVCPAARAAFVLRRLDGMADVQIEELLVAAGADKVQDALRASYRLEEVAGKAAEALLRSREFDACSVQTRPTDLVRRRRRVRLFWIAMSLAVLSALVLTGLEARGGGQSAPAAQPTGARANDLVRVPAQEWSDTARVDFTAWPARGARTDDRALLTRALAAWSSPPRGTEVTSAPATDTAPPGRSPQLLYAGDVDGRTVVLFHDGERVVHYGEPLPGKGGPHPSLHFARADNSGVTTSAALAVHRGDGRVRYLTAPWIAETQTRDLLRPDSPNRPLKVSPDGLTAPVRGPVAGGSCDTWPVLWLRSSSRIVEKHAFLLSDLGGLLPVHLSYTPLPGNGVPARQPREVISPLALRSWARTACRLPELGSGARSVNVWDFAEQDLPESAGQAVWSCARTTTWRGPGQVLLQFAAPATGDRGAARVVARARSTAACGRFGQHVVASTTWRADSGKRYVLAAGSREVTGIDTSGDVRASASGRTLAKPVPKGARVEVRARLSTGGTLAPVGSTE